MKQHVSSKSSSPPSSQRLALSARDLMGVLGVGLRSARLVARTLGRRVGNKFLVSPAAVVRWLERKSERRG
jgi:hypothetical protein